jgi:hypothetical protein
MALRDLIRKEAQKALSTGGYLQDIPVRGSYLPVSEAGDFDPVSQTSAASGALKSVDMVFAEVESKHVDGVNVLPFDKMVYISDLNIIKEGIAEPSPHDQIFDLDGSVWTVIHTSTDPVRAVHILHVRKP